MDKIMQKYIVNCPDFLTMPKEIYFNLNLPDGAFKLFSVFNLYQNSESGCYASNFYLSKVVGMDERSITRNISILEKWFYIKIENKKSPTKRRIFINSKYKEIYDKPVKEVWEMRKSVEKFNSKKIKEIFINARENIL